FMKPLLTHSYPPLTVTLPACLVPITKFLTTKEQRNQNRNERSSQIVIPSLDNHNELVLNSKYDNSTVELIDMEGISSNAHAYYPVDSIRKSNLQNDQLLDVEMNPNVPINDETILRKS
ncbi:unnamed protein product, partial [Rotaria sp. Silwood1]